MKVLRSWLCLFLLLISAHRLPAPISEIPQTTPTPKPKREAAPRSKPKAKTDGLETSRQTQTKSKQSPFAPFAGTWTGTVTSSATATLLFSTTSSMALPVTIRVSKTGVVNYGAEQPVQGTLSGDGHVLSWSIRKNISDMVSRVNSSLRLIGTNSASYSDTNALDGAIAAVSGNSTGTLYRR